MTHCNHCKRRINGLPLKCRYCNGYYCDKHRLPEDHNCRGLKEFKEGNKERWDKVIKEEFSPSKSTFSSKQDYTSHKRPRFIGKILSWLNWRGHRSYSSNRIGYLIKILLIFIASIVFFNIFYSNTIKLNSINLWIIKLGGVLILTSIIFILIFGWKLLKELVNLIKRQKNWIKYLIIILIIILLWQGYTHKDTALNPIFNAYNKTNFSLFSPLSFNESFNGNNSSSINSVINNIGTVIAGPQIDSTWVNNFMSIVNQDREAKGLQPLVEQNSLDTFAQQRFVKMQESPFISHYGFPSDAYGIGEVIYYPQGQTEQSYVNDLQNNAVLHWNLMMDPSFTSYGYHLEIGPDIAIIGSCPVTEIPGPNIDVKQFFNSNGCQTTETNDLWLVIDMS